MPQTQSAEGRRETRLLLVTIGVGIAALLLLAQFRFPEQTTAVANPAPAPLERLAARAAYDELASGMSDLERRLETRVTILRVDPPRATGAYLVAPRVSSGRVVTLLAAGETLHPTGASPIELIAWDRATGVAVIGSASDGDLVTPRIGAPRSGPRYVATLEPTESAPLVQPTYVGRTTVSTDPRTSAPLYSLHALQYPISRGTPIFTLDGVFLGLVDDGKSPASVLTGEFLRTLAESAVRTSPQTPASLGLQVQDASATVLRAAGATRGVVVSYVEPGGPADGLVQVGDVIHAVDGTVIGVAADFHEMTMARRPGDRVSLDVVRLGNATQETVVARSQGAWQDSGSDEFGLIGRAVADAGIEVVAVQLHSAAGRAGLRRGDLILTINGQPARDVFALTQAYRTLSPKGSALLSVQRGDEHVVLALEKP